ncbi:endo-1,4-beta-xylanase [Actinophytocola sp.]|uniref:endo-1,4-beta-xylanase n=1 Tax=Actinophytocola sp. TaxID=1872138 RepID=UPI002ED62FF1
MVTRSLRTTARRALVLAAAGAMAVTGVVALSGTANAATTLGASAAERGGRYFGAAVAANHLGEARYFQTWTTEFNGATPENEMKWQTIEPSRNQFNFAPANQIVTQARSRGMKVRGHTLVWHSQLAGWVSSLDATNLRSAMNNHINRVMGQWRGQIHSWDVVNEAFEENGSRRQSVFQQRLGNGYIEEAFRAARTADPNAKLCYNDYNTDGINAKSNAVFALVQDFRNRGVPIDCVGFQSHFNGASPVPGNYQQNLQRFANLGVDVQITELDIEGSGTAQANNYRNVVNACLAVSRCTGITVWGIPDHYSWRPNGTPLLFDSNYNKKAAYTAVLNALNTGQSDPPPNDPPPNDPPPNDPPPTTGACAATVSTNQWTGGFVGSVRVTAGSAQVNAWTVTVTLPSGATLTSGWNADRSGNTGTVQFTNVGFNGSIAPGQSVDFGYQGTGTGTGVTPTCAAS